MNYYLVPQNIAESLQLTRIRKSSAGGMFLLSEYDLQPYGIERAIGEGATELSENRAPVPTAEPEQEQLPSEEVGESQAGTVEDSQLEQEDPEEEQADPADEPEAEEEDNNETDNGGE